MALTGRAVLVVLLGLVAVVLAPSAATVRLWTLGVALLVAVDVFLAPRTRTVEVRRHGTRPLRRLETGVSTLVVTNTSGRRVRGVLRDAWQPSAQTTGERHRLDLGPGAVSTLDTPLHPTRRGEVRTDRLTLRLTGPLGLAARQRSVDVPGRVRVLPEFPSRRHLPRLLTRMRDLDGRAAARVRCNGTEFDSLRDYVDGDDVRSIDWRASARHRGTVVRTWRPERDRHIVVVVDTSRTSAGRIGDTPRLDAAIDAALLLGVLAARAGDRVDLVAGDLAVRAVAHGTRRDDLLRTFSDALSPLEPALVEADWGMLATQVGRLARQRALVVLVTPLEPVAVRENLAPALATLTAGHRVVIASVQDPELGLLAAGHSQPTDGPDQPSGSTTPAPASEPTRHARGDHVGVEDAYLAAAAEQALHSRGRTADALRRLGVDVLDAPPDDLPLRLCEHYLALKDRGRL